MMTASRANDQAGSEPGHGEFDSVHMQTRSLIKSRICNGKGT